MKLSNVLWFVGGAATGSLVVWQLLKRKYQKIADEEIASVKEAYKNKKPVEEVKIPKEVIEEARNTRDEQIAEKREMAHSAFNKPDIHEYAERVSEYTANPHESAKRPMAPYIISEDEFGNCDYACLSFTYYADDILADDGDFVVDDIDRTVGIDNLDDLAAKREDIIYVRNDERRTDYEIARSERLYSEVVQ